jgi:hypothetical protein
LLKGFEMSDRMRAAFMAWVQDQGCDTDGAWSAWQACWKLHNADAIGENGLTEAETSATASVMGIVGKQERYVVRKEVGSEWARVVDTQTGMQIARYNVMPRKRSLRDGWKEARNHADRLNAAPAAPQ